MQSAPVGAVNQNSLYEQVVDAYGSSLDRLARAYELDADARRDLLQDIHLQLWRSFAYFDQRCSLRTWVYRVAHNVATKHVMRQRRIRDRLVNIENFDFMPGSDQAELAASQAEALGRLSMLIQRLKPLDRQIIVSYLEGHGRKLNWRDHRVVAREHLHEGSSHQEHPETLVRRRRTQCRMSRR